MAGLRLFAGCYERFLFGFDCPESLMTAASTSSSGQPIALERKCTFAAHKVLHTRVMGDTSLTLKLIHPCTNPNELRHQQWSIGLVLHLSYD